MNLRNRLSTCLTLAYSAILAVPATLARRVGPRRVV